MSSYPAPDYNSNTFNTSDYNSNNSTQTGYSQTQANALFLKKNGDRTSGLIIFDGGEQVANPSNILFSSDNSTLQTKLDSKQNTIISSTNLSINNLTTGGNISQTNSSLTNNLLGKLTVGNSSDQRGILTNNFTSTIAKSNDTDIQDANRPFCNDNVTTNNSTSNIMSGICLQINPTGTLNSGRAIGDIMLVRENNTTASFFMSAFQGSTYRDLMKIAFGNSFIRGGLNIGSNNTSYSDKLNIEGTAMIGNILRMNNVSPITIIPTVNDVISWVSGIVYYWANGVNTAIHSSNSIDHMVTTAITNGNLYSGSLELNGIPNGDSFIRNTGASGSLYLGGNNTNQLLLNSSGLQFQAPLYQGMYQRKVYLSSSGLLQHYPSWTTLTPQTNTTGTLNFDIGNNITFPYLDTTNFIGHKIRFQGYVNPNGSANKPHLAIQYLINGSTSGVPNMENTVFFTPRGSAMLSQMDSSTSAPSCKILDSIANDTGSIFDFGGELNFYSNYGGAPEIQVDAFYVKSQVGTCKVFGTTRAITGTTLYNFNGIRFQFSNMALTTQTIYFRFCVESF